MVNMPLHFMVMTVPFSVRQLQSAERALPELRGKAVRQMQDVSDHILAEIQLFM